MHQPYGLEGGEPGEKGKNIWIKQPRKEDGDVDSDPSRNKPRIINIGGKASVLMGKGDRIIINTPGAGAWGKDTGQRGGEYAQKIEWAARGSLAERAAAQAGF